MKETVLNQIKELNNKEKELNNIFESNNIILEKLKKDKKVLEFFKLLEESNRIRVEKNNIKNKINSLINNNCNHNLLIFKEHSIDMYDSYNIYYCVECGKNIESTCKLNNVINSDISLNLIRKEYYDYLLKYNVATATELMLYKYNDKEFNEFIKSGLDEIKSLKLIKKLKKV